MDPTVHQIIFFCIIMLARKVAADLCLLLQSLPHKFMCTIHPSILARAMHLIRDGKHESISKQGLLSSMSCKIRAAFFSRK
jgi:hypothetical protein